MADYIDREGIKTLCEDALGVPCNRDCNHCEFKWDVVMSMGDILHLPTVEQKHGQLKI